MLAFFVKVLGIETPIKYSSDLNVSGEATARLINVIEAVGGDAYYSGAYALDVYLDAAMLEEAGIALELQEWKCPIYPQRHGPFGPDLSVVDLLMNCGPQSRAVLLGADSDPS